MALTPDEQIELERLRSKFKKPAATPSSIAQSSPAESGLLESMAKSAPVQATLGFGDALSNMLSASASTLSQIPNKAGITDWKGIGYNPIKSGQGMAYSAGEIAGNMAPFIAGPQAATIPARLATSAATGYLFNPENSLQGAKEGLGWGIVGETLPGIGPASKYIKNKFTREDLVPSLKEPIQKAYETAKTKAWKPVAGLFEESKGYKLSNDWVNDIGDMFTEKSQYMTSSIKKELQNFMKDKDLKSLHKLQSQVSTDIRKLDPSQATNLSAIETRGKWKDSLNANIEEYLSAFSDKGPELYREAMQNYAIGPAPFKDNPSVKKVLSGVTEGVTPEKLISDLKKQSQKQYKPGQEKLSPEHYLREALTKAEGKMSRTDLYKNAAGLASMIGGAGIGAAMYGPAGLLGGGAGFILPKAGELAGNIATNEAISKALGKIYPGIRAGIVGNAVATPNQPVTVDLTGEY